MPNSKTLFCMSSIDRFSHFDGTTDSHLDGTFPAIHGQSWLSLTWWLQCCFTRWGKVGQRWRHAGPNGAFLLLYHPFLDLVWGTQEFKLIPSCMKQYRQSVFCSKSAGLRSLEPPRSDVSLRAIFPVLFGHGMACACVSATCHFFCTISFYCTTKMARHYIYIQNWRFYCCV